MAAAAQQSVAPPTAAVVPVAATLAQAQLRQFATKLKFSQILVLFRLNLYSKCNQSLEFNLSR